MVSVALVRSVSQTSAATPLAPPPRLDHHKSPPFPLPPTASTHSRRSISLTAWVGRHAPLKFQKFFLLVFSYLGIKKCRSPICPSKFWPVGPETEWGIGIDKLHVDTMPQALPLPPAPRVIYNALFCTKLRAPQFMQPSNGGCGKYLQGLPPHPSHHILCSHSIPSDGII